MGIIMNSEQYKERYLKYKNKYMELTGKERLSEELDLNELSDDLDIAFSDDFDNNDLVIGSDDPNENVNENSNEEIVDKNNNDDNDDNEDKEDNVVEADNDKSDLEEADLEEVEVEEDDVEKNNKNSDENNADDEEGVEDNVDNEEIDEEIDQDV